MVSLGEQPMEQPIDIRGKSPTCACWDDAWSGCACAWPSSIRTSRVSCATCRTSSRPRWRRCARAFRCSRMGRGRLTPSQREAARILRQNTSVLQAQIEDLLRFNAAAFDARQLAARHGAHGPGEGGRGPAAAAMAGAPAHGRGTGEPLLAEVDPDKMRAALGNLLSNAIRFSPVGAYRASTFPSPACRAAPASTSWTRSWASPRWTGRARSNPLRPQRQPLRRRARQRHRPVDRVRIHHGAWRPGRIVR